MWERVCFRAAAYRTPVRVRDHGAADGARYHEPGSEATQYFSLHPLGPWAEQVRNQRCTTLEDALEIRLPVWAVRVVLPSEPLILDFDVAASGSWPHPITPEGLVADDHGECRALAAAHRRDPAAARSLRVPSAALPATENLVILGRRRGIEYLAHPRRAVQIPYAAAGVDARMAARLFPQIRLHGEPHAGLEAWRRGEDLRLPEVSLAAA